MTAPCDGSTPSVQNTYEAITSSNNRSRLDKITYPKVSVR